MTDPIVNEVRKYRMNHTRRFNGKLSEICRDLREFQKTCSHRLVRLPPKRIPPAQRNYRHFLTTNN